MFTKCVQSYAESLICFKIIQESNFNLNIECVILFAKRVYALAYHRIAQARIFEIKQCICNGILTKTPDPLRMGFGFNCLSGNYKDFKNGIDTTVFCLSIQATNKKNYETEFTKS